MMHSAPSFKKIALPMHSDYHEVARPTAPINVGAASANPQSEEEKRLNPKPESSWYSSLSNADGGSLGMERDKLDELCNRLIEAEGEVVRNDSHVTYKRPA